MYFVIEITEPGGATDHFALTTKSIGNGIWCAIFSHVLTRRIYNQNSDPYLMREHLLPLSERP